MAQIGERGSRRAVFQVRGIDCATCSLAIEKRLRRLDGVLAVGAAIMLNKVFVDYDPSRVGIEEIRKAIGDAGYSGYVALKEERGSARRP